MKEPITLVVNGETRQLDGGATLMTLLQSLDLDPLLVVAELNRTIVKRDAYSTTMLNSDDELELVHFVGGG